MRYRIYSRAVLLLYYVVSSFFSFCRVRAVVVCELILRRLMVKDTHYTPKLAIISYQHRKHEENEKREQAF